MWVQELNGVPISLMAADGKLIILEADGTLRIAEATSSAYEELSSGDVLEGECNFHRLSPALIHAVS